MEAIVEYNYVAQEPDELTLRKGDVIKEIKVMVRGWCEGTLRGRRGMFPDNFVKVIEPASAAGSGTATAAAVLPAVDSDSSPTLRREEVPLRNGSGRRWCKVLFSYDPCNEDELALVPHESIEFLGEIEEGWWKGRFRGCVGVFPSNFVSPPAPEEKDLCKVLFPYDAANEDELTLVEGDIVTILSRDAPDRGWWKGELRGQVGLFPDNFVEVLSSKNEQRRSDPDQWHETNQGGSKSSSSKHSSYTRQRGEKAHARKSLDSRLVHSESSTKKSSVSSASSTVSSSTSQMTGTTSSDKKSAVGNHMLMSRLKLLIGDGTNAEGNDNAETDLGEELDGVERGEGAPLSHLTASRAKAPRRRLPSTQLLRHQTSSTTVNVTPTSVSTLSTAISENNIANGNADTALEQLREDESDAPVGKARRKAPWIEELKLNQMEKRKTTSTDKVEKVDTKKERSFPRSVMSTSATEVSSKSQQDSDDIWIKDKDKSPRTDAAAHTCPVSPTTTPSTPAYVPYHLYNQLLDRVATLEEKQIMLQRTVSQLSELIPMLGNTSTNNKV